MEKIRFGNGMEFELVVNGVDDFIEDQLILKVLPNGRGLEELENILSVQENVERIGILSEQDELLRSFKGYKNLVALEKNRLVSYIEDTDNENQDEKQVLTSVIVTARLCRTSVRAELEALKSGMLLQDSAIAELGELVSSIVEGGEV